MQTLNQRLFIYCTDNKKEIPYALHLLLLGTAIMDHLRNIGKNELVEKLTVPEAMKVNHFPDELLPEVDEIIARYFENPDEFIRTTNRAHAKRPKNFGTFHFFVENHRCIAFEKACHKLCIKFVKGELNEKGNSYNYLIHRISLQGCINLGVLFQKLRTNEKYGDLLQKNKNAPATTKRKRIAKS